MRARFELFCVLLLPCSTIVGREQFSWAGLGYNHAHPTHLPGSTPAHHHIRFNTRYAHNLPAVGFSAPLATSAWPSAAHATPSNVRITGDANGITAHKHVRLYACAYSRLLLNDSAFAGAPELSPPISSCDDTRSVTDDRISSRAPSSYARYLDVITSTPRSLGPGRCWWTWAVIAGIVLAQLSCPLSLPHRQKKA